MDINGYQQMAMRTSNRNLSPTGHLLNGVLGIAGEGGEVADLVKKHLYQGHELNKEKIAQELGDIAWYLAETAYALDVELDAVFEQNINKLKARYPEGFETEKSLNRQE